jgi:hypothetical protein
LSFLSLLPLACGGAEPKTMLTGEEKKGKLESKEKNLLMNNAILTKKLFSNKFGESKAVIL